MEDIARTEKYAKVIGVGFTIIITLCTLVLGGFGAYLADQAAIAKNTQMIQQNSQQINSIKREIREQSNTMNTILMKVTRMETTLDIAKKHLFGKQV